MLIGLIKTLGTEESQLSAHYNLWVQAQMINSVFLKFCFLIPSLSDS